MILPINCTTNTCPPVDPPSIVCESLTLTRTHTHTHTTSANYLTPQPHTYTHTKHLVQPTNRTNNQAHIQPSTQPTKRTTNQARIQQPYDTTVTHRSCPRLNIFTRRFRLNLTPTLTHTSHTHTYLPLNPSHPDLCLMEQFKQYLHQYTHTQMGQRRDECMERKRQGDRVGGTVDW